MREDHTYFIIDKDSITEDQKYKAKNRLFRESTAGEYLVQVKGNVDLIIFDGCIDSYF